MNLEQIINSEFTKRKILNLKNKTKMNILLIGYGKMGRMIEEIALERNHKIVHTIDNDYQWKTLEGKEVDIAIDFSIPMLADYNIMECFNRDIPIVVGTTGWYNKLPSLRTYCQENNKSMFVASNYSIGVYIFNQINQALAKLMNNQPSYDVSMEEVHHTQKLDTPSGTAITLAENIIDNIDRKTKWSCIEERDMIDEGIEKSHKDNELLIYSKRIGDVTGNHTINYISDIDQITITHKAYNRKGFALGAVLAAEFLKNKKGFYTMKDMINK